MTTRKILCKPKAHYYINWLHFTIFDIMITFPQSTLIKDKFSSYGLRKGNLQMDQIKVSSLYQQNMIGMLSHWMLLEVPVKFKINFCGFLGCRTFLLASCDRAFVNLNANQRTNKMYFKNIKHLATLFYLQKRYPVNLQELHSEKMFK